MSSVKTEYTCQVTIIEGRELAAADPSGSCDPFVRIRCGNLKPQQGRSEESTTNPCWNQSFTFSNVWMTDVELETWELKIECFDYNAFVTNKLIGANSIGLATLHRNRGHEFYQKWITLIHPEKRAEPQGYLLINCFIVAPHDIIPAHPIGEVATYDEDIDSEEEFQQYMLPPNKRKELANREDDLQILRSPKLAHKSLQLSINIMSAELYNYSRFNYCVFVSCRTMGLFEITRNVDGNPNPVWNRKLCFPAYKPILNDRITIRLWDYKYMGRNKLIASIPEVPRENDDFSINNLLSKGGVMTPRWIHLYGNDPTEETMWRNIKKSLGSVRKTYYGTFPIGKILISMSVTPNDNPKTGDQEAPSYRAPKEDMRKLRVIVYEIKHAQNLGDVSLKVLMGPIESDYYGYNFKNKGADNENVYVFGSPSTGQKIEDVNRFPVDITQTPDVFINLYSRKIFNGEERVGYIRLSLNDIKFREPMWVPFKSIDKHSSVGRYSPGTLLVSINFGSPEDVDNYVAKSKPPKKKWFLHWNVFCGVDMAPNLGVEDTTIGLRILCGDEIINMPADKQQESQKFPKWEWSNSRELQLREMLNYEQNLVVEVNSELQKHWYSLNSKYEVGQFTIPLVTCLEDWERPCFFHVINPLQEKVSQGRIFAQFMITEDKKNPIEKILEYKEYNISLAMIGIRNLLPEYSKMDMSIQIPGYTEEKKWSFPKKGEYWDGINPNILKVKSFKNVLLPEKPIYLPAIYIKFKDTGGLSVNECFTIIPLVHYWKDCDEEKKRIALEAFNNEFTEAETIEQYPRKSRYFDQQKQTKADEFTDLELEEETDSPTLVPKKLTQKMKEKKEAQTIRDIFEPKNEHMGKVVQFDNTSKDVRVVKAETEKKKESLRKRRDELEDMKKTLKKGQADELIRKELKQIYNKLDHFENIEMTEAKFFRIGDDEEDENKYKRPIHKDGVYEDSFDLPYERYNLYQMKSDRANFSLNKKGVSTGAVLKLCVHISPAQLDEEEDRRTDEEIKNKKYNWKLDFFHHIFKKENFAYTKELMKKIFDAAKNYQVRVYLLRGISLSAVDNAADWVAFGGGLSAIASADTYPEVYLARGSGLKNKSQYFNDETNPEWQTLNPDYYRTYIFDATIPRDCLTVINIHSHSKFFNKFIGQTEIDIEDRFFCNSDFTRQIMLKKVKKYCNNKKDDGNETDRKWYIAMREAAKNSLSNNSGDFKFSIEYRTIYARKSGGPRGSVELFVEVFDANVAKMYPIEHISKPRPEEYELRLIVWRCEGIPRGDKAAIDIFFKVEFNPEGWAGEPMTINSDTHLGSEDGHGVFNYRMKFPFKIPCPFTRLQFVAIDFETFNDDIVISEGILDLERYIKVVKKQGQLEKDEKWLNLNRANVPNSNGGRVLVSFKIINKAEADRNPVGLGREEPNRDPFLEEPTEGRGIAAYLTGTVVDPSNWNFLNIGLIKKLLALLSVLGLGFVLFIQPGFLVN